MGFWSRSVKIPGGKAREKTQQRVEMSGTTSTRDLMVGNWKMNASHLEAIQMVQKLSYRLEPDDFARVDVVAGTAFHGAALGADRDRSGSTHPRPRCPERALGGVRCLHR